VLNCTILPALPDTNFFLNFFSNHNSPSSLTPIIVGTIGSGGQFLKFCCPEPSINISGLKIRSVATLEVTKATTCPDIFYISCNKHNENVLIYNYLLVQPHSGNYNQLPYADFLQKTSWEHAICRGLHTVSILNFIKICLVATTSINYTNNLPLKLFKMRCYVALINIYSIMEVLYTSKKSVLMKIKMPP
jgi:hypothetical protein